MYYWASSATAQFQRIRDFSSQIALQSNQTLTAVTEETFFNPDKSNQRGVTLAFHHVFAFSPLVGHPVLRPCHERDAMIYISQYTAHNTILYRACS